LQAKREFEASRRQPKSLGSVLLGDLELPDRLTELLFDNRYRSASDLANATDEDLRKLPGLGVTYVAQIRQQCEEWVDNIANAL
jgi:hypothetical protein